MPYSFFTTQMKGELMEKTEKRLYLLGWFALLVLFVMVAVLNWINWDFLTLVPPCAVRFITGYYCPGCGGTRAVRALLQGRLITSFLYHPFVLYCVTIMVVFMVTNTIQLLTKNKWKIGLKYRHGYLYGATIVIIANWIIQNIFIFLNK